MSTTRLLELKPCPFCNGTASLGLCGFGTARVACMDCGSEGAYSPSREEAIAAWNRRDKAVRLAVWKEAIEAAAEAVPTNWCDELLTGKGGIGQPPYSCPDVEKLLTNLRAAIRSLPDPSVIQQARRQ